MDYCGLAGNPCHSLIGRLQRDNTEISFWTHDEYKTFIQHVTNPIYYNAFELLYYCGMRIGELLALTPSDFDFQTGMLSINKTYGRINGQDLITEPKTQKSKRRIKIPSFLCNEIQNYIGQLYGINNTDRLFPYLEESLDRVMKIACKKSGIHKIRIHDIRHSHASLLIELGFSPLLISERLGHERIETTLNIYSHLYPNKQSEVSEKLDSLRN